MPFAETVDGRGDDGSSSLPAALHNKLADGSVAQPLGKVGAQVTLEQGHTAARLTALAILGAA